MQSTNSTVRYRSSRLAAIALVLCLLTTSTPAAPATIVALATESTTSFGFWFRASGWGNLLQGRQPKVPKESQRDRNAKVSVIKIFPGDLTVQLDQRVTFAAVAYDYAGSSISGVKFKWSAVENKGKRKASISPTGEFKALSAGTFKVVAEASGQTAQATVIVSRGKRLPRPTDTPTTVRPVSNRERPNGTAKAGSQPTNNTAPAKQEKPPAPQGKSAQKSKSSSKAASYAHGARPAASAPVFFPTDGWTDDNYWSSSEPGNEVGETPGSPMDGGAGSGNFQFAAPILGLPGRGINLSLGAAYNSRLWNKAGSEITYDIDRSWPAPGFSLGFGKLLGLGVYHGGMLVDADGTRHSFTGSVSAYGSGSRFVGHTTDGSFIDYSYITGTGGAITTAEAKLPNGTIINYEAAGTGGIYPTRITDANGNYITITYVGNTGPNISTITDTLGRVIHFYYNSNNLLTAITTPAYNSSGERTLVRFHYQQLTLSYAFSGLTTVVRDSSPWVIDAIYYPGTSTGYWFGDSDSYSSYGMLAKVVEQRNMGFSASGLTDMGSVSQGSTTRTETYDYDLSANSSLTDAPTYTEMVESWTRDGTSTTDSATTTYEVYQNSNPRTVTITLPNGTKSKQYSYNHSGYYDDGLVYLDQTLNSSNTVLQSSSSTWEEGAYNSPRPTRIEKTDELEQTTAAEFDYGSFNQVTKVWDYGYGGTTLLRTTRTEYENSDNYTGHSTSYGYVGRHIFNLPLNVGTYNSDDSTRVSFTEYQYDGQTLSETPDVTMHHETYNPYAEEYEQCDCSQYDQNQIECLQWNCYMTSVYSSATAYRGNVTQITKYADANASSPSGAITETLRYDVTGNMIKASSACCDQTTYEYTIDYQFAYPESVTSGSATDGYAQVKTSAIYDLHTGLLTTATDANDHDTVTGYDSDSLRPTSLTLSTGAHTDYDYDDTDMTVASTTYLSSADGGGIAEQSIKYLNGHGQVRLEKERGPDSGGNQTWDAVSTIHNNLGQVYQRSRPYRYGTDTPVYSTAAYDLFGRTTRVTAPDGSVTETYYNGIDFDTTDSYTPQRPGVASSSAGETTLVRDAWGRERWGRTDASGRLVEVVEPNPSGNGSTYSNGWVTTYAYDTFGNLTTVTQDAQTRSFAYDSLGRLTAQKLAETEATLNSSGTYVGTSSGTWSDVFTYDSRSNLTSRTDARGVKTVYSYLVSSNPDPLNRLQSVSWDTTGFGDTGNSIASAATVSYSYRTKSSGTDLRDVTQLSSISTSGVSTESFSYDSEDRVYIQTLTHDSRSSYPFATTYSFDSLDRITDVQYPAEYGNGSAPRKVVHHSFDIASRVTGLTYDSQSFASSIVFNAASQTTSLNVGSGTNQITESYSFGSTTGLLDSQTVTRGSTTLLNLSYDYANSSGKRTGQLVKLLNNLDHSKDRGYTYDALGRLTQATGGPASSVLSTTTYTYDKYGNRTGVSASGESARGTGRPTSKQDAVVAQNQRDRNSTGFSKPADPKVELPTDLLAKGNSLERDPSAAVDDASRSLFKPRNAEPPLPSSPPAYTDPDLLASGVVIKALHITELRAAINNLRVRLGMSSFTWTKPTATGGSVQSGDSVTAEPIVEMRTALDQALGAPSGGYAAGLAQGQPILAVHIQELRDRVTSGWNASSQIPRDGHASLSYDTASNRITTSGFAYDKAGNQVRALIPGGSGSQRYKYDAANRMVQVLADNGTTVLATYTYGSSNQRLVGEENGLRTYYACGGGVEYMETGSSTTPAWSKSYVYLGTQVLATQTPNGSGGEATEFHHPDRLGTRLVTNPNNGSYFEQVTMPFGTPLYAESSGGMSRRFTSYDRSVTTGLDYANNRHYDAQQGRFTQVDPAGMSLVSLDSPQTLNLYAYCINDPINHTDPSGLGFLSKLFSAIGKIMKIITVALLVAALVVTTIIFAAPAGSLLFSIAKWTLFKVLIPASKILAKFGVMTPGSLMGFQTPQWNPSSGSIFGNSFQDPKNPAMPNGPLDVVVVNKSTYGPWWDEFLKAVTSKGINWPWLMGEFLSGKGPRIRRFDSTSVLTQNLRSSPDVAAHRRQFCASGKTTYNSDSHPARYFGWGGSDSPWQAGPMNEGRQFIGSFEMRILSMGKGWKGYALFVARNKTSTASGVIHFGNRYLVPEIKSPGALQTTTQFFWWIEHNPCKK